MNATPLTVEAPVNWLVPPRIQWKLKELLQRERVTPNELSVRIRESIDPSVDRNAIYRLTRSVPQRPDMNLLAAILAGLELITKRAFELTDLMDYDRDGEA